MSDVLRSIIAVTGRDRPNDVAFVLAHYIQNSASIRCSVAAEEDGSILGFQSLIHAEPGNRYDVPAGWGIIGTHIAPTAQRRGV